MGEKSEIYPPTTLVKWIFIQIPKKDNTKEPLNYCTIMLISCAGKIMF